MRDHAGRGRSMPSIVLATSNGTGMGHLTRQLAVALALGSEARVHVFSLSLAMPVVQAHGLRGEYCPSYDRGWIPRESWNSYLRDRLVAFCREVRADVVLFDGVAPYAGILMARARLGGVRFAWCRRGMWRDGANDRALTASSAFDLVIEPGDLAAHRDTGPTASRHDAHRVPPISLTEMVHGLSRRNAAVALGLDPERPTALVTLGSGRLGDPAAAATAVLEELLSDGRWQVALTRPGIATQALPVIDPARVVELRDVYPLARHLAAFDLAVSAAGYNAVHEFLPAAVPTLLVPSPSTVTDDQVSRAQGCAERGLALWAHQDDLYDVRARTRDLMSDEVRLRLRARCVLEQQLHPATGATAVASLLLAEASHSERTPGWGHEAVVRARAARWSLRTMALRILGPTGSNVVRALLGRPPVAPAPSTPSDGAVVLPGHTPTVPASVVPVHDMARARQLMHEGQVPLMLTYEVDAASVRSGVRVEHLMLGTSRAYRVARNRIVARYHRIRPICAVTATQATRDEAERVPAVDALAGHDLRVTGPALPHEGSNATHRT